MQLRGCCSWGRELLNEWMCLICEVIVIDSDTWDLQEQGCCFITVKTNNWSNKFTALCSGNPSLVRLPWVTVRPFRIETSQHYRTPAHKQVFSHGTAVCTLFICITLWWPNLLSGPFLDEFYCKHGRPPSVKPQTHSASLCMFSLSATLTPHLECKEILNYSHFSHFVHIKLNKLNLR